MLTPEQVQAARAKYGIQPDAINRTAELDAAWGASEQTERPVAQDIMIGAAKGLGRTLKSTGDAIAKAAPSLIPGPIDAIPQVRKKVSDVVDRGKEKLQGAIGLTEENLEPENTPQKIGMYGELGAELLSPFLWARVSRLAGAKHSIDEVADMADTVQKKVLQTSDEVLEGKATPGQLKEIAEKGAPKVSFKEKLAGLAPDIKRRIQGKGRLLADYMNVTDARNVNDLSPTPLEYAASFATRAKKEMEAMLSDTGSKIGTFRKRIATYKAPQYVFREITDDFVAQLKKLNLEIKDGTARVIPGRIVQTISDGEINALNSLYSDLKIASQSPSLENIIDLRNKFSNKINFDKLARDVSTTLDPLSRAMRAKLATVAETIVGKSESANLKAYSEFMDAYDDLRGYVDRRAGSEFLLKRVFSERGGDPRRVMETIRTHTGIDLMDHALMSKIATELGGNSQMQGLFRQELTKAGMDAVNLLRGNPVGAATTLFEKGMEKILDKRKVFEKAANEAPGGAFGAAVD